ncbi:hypothetical protein ACDH50_19245, partial [Xanthomonas fragariae]
NHPFKEKPIPPPPVPQKLREILKDYPELIQRLQDVLDAYVQRPFKLMPFDGAIWALEGRLGSFISEAREELESAKSSGDAAAIGKAQEKELLMFRASSKYRWITDDKFEMYFNQLNGDIE